MLYERPKFTCPAAGQNTTQKNWDRAFLSEIEFSTKYGEAVVEFHTNEVPAILPEHSGSTLVVKG